MPTPWTGAAGIGDRDRPQHRARDMHARAPRNGRGALARAPPLPPLGRCPVTPAVMIRCGLHGEQFCLGLRCTVVGCAGLGAVQEPPREGRHDGCSQPRAGIAAVPRRRWSPHSFWVHLRRGWLAWLVEAHAAYAACSVRWWRVRAAHPPRSHACGSEWLWLRASRGLALHVASPRLSRCPHGPRPVPAVRLMCASSECA